MKVICTMQTSLEEYKLYNIPQYQWPRGSSVHQVKLSLALAIFFLVAFPVWPQGGSRHCKVIFLSPPETETGIRV